MRYAIIIKSVVTNIVEWDGVSDWKPTEGKAVVVDDSVGIGWIWSNGKFIPPEEPELSHDELTTYTSKKKAALIDEIVARTAMWRTELQLGVISDTDKAKLVEWMQYYKQIQAINVDNVTGITWPVTPLSLN